MMPCREVDRVVAGMTHYRSCGEPAVIGRNRLLF
jgi:hypothetical protein